MKKPENVKELCEFIWYLEDEYNLLDFEIEGVKPWQAYRLEIYYSIGKSLGVFDNSLNRNMSKAKRIKSFFSLLKNALLYNPYFGLKKVDTLIFSHSRSKIVDNKYIDIYTKYFIDDLLQDKESFLEFEEHYQGEHIREKKNYIKYLDYITLLKNIRKRFIDIKLDTQTKRIIESVTKEIQDICKIEYDLENILIEATKRFKVTIVYYDKILKRTNPKEIYVVVSYGNGKSELIYLAKKYNIKVIEFQHGTFSKYHLGYSYPNDNRELDYFPNEFWVWNEYWKNLIDFPISKKDVKIYPFRYLEEEKKKYSNKKIKNQLVVLGQGGLTENMTKIILKNIEFFKKFKIIVKLHPEEYGHYKNYKQLKSLINLLDVIILEDTDLYKLLSESEYQAGVFSTALYEGVEFGCKTILFDLPGIEYMDKFIEYEKLILKDNIYVS